MKCLLLQAIMTLLQMRVMNTNVNKSDKTGLLAKCQTRRSPGGFTAAVVKHRW